MTHSYDFLEQLEPAQDQARHTRKRWLRVFLIVTAVLLVAWFIVLCVGAGKVLSSFADVRTSFEDARASVETMEFEEATDSLQEASIYLEQAQAGMYWLNTLKIIPWVGNTITSADRVTDALQELSIALQSLTELGEDLVRIAGLESVDGDVTITGEVSFADLPSETKKTVLQRLSAAADDLPVVKNQLAIVQSELGRWLVLLPKTISAPIASQAAQLSDLQEQLDTMSVAATVLPELAGLDEEKTFLLLFLNNHELRPGGGFIGTYGIMNVLNGDFTGLQTDDVYNLDRLVEEQIEEVPPQPLQDYNASSKWFFRDANWSPDFVFSSLEVIERYLSELSLTTEEQRATIPYSFTIHGVVGFTPSLAEEILNITGPLVVSGQTFTADNVAELIEYQVEVAYAEEGIPESQRKEILGDLVDQMKDRLFQLPFTELSGLLELFKEGMDDKQLVFYSTNQEIEEILIEAGWAGRINPPETSDVQMVVDANLASLKSDPVVERTISYEAFENSAGESVGRTTIRYEHKGSFDWKTSRYRTYTRLYVPKGSTFLQAEGTLLNDRSQNPSETPGPVDITEELGLTVFGAFTSVEPGQTQELVFEYLLAPQVVELIESGAYSLHFFKQIGAFEHELELSLSFPRPIQSASVPEESSEWGNSHYQLNTYLDQDKVFEVLF